MNMQKAGKKCVALCNITLSLLILIQNKAFFIASESNTVYTAWNFIGWIFSKIMYNECRKKVIFMIHKLWILTFDKKKSNFCAKFLKVYYSVVSDLWFPDFFECITVQYWIPIVFVSLRWERKCYGLLKERDR